MYIFSNISGFFKFLQALHESLYRVETGNYDYRYDFAFLSITPRKHRNGRNIAQYCWMLLVLSVCTPCCMLLHVVGSCYAKFETSRTFEPTTPNINFVLFCDCQSIPQQCWIRLHSSIKHCITRGLQSLMGCILSLVHSGSNIVGSCCIRFPTTTNKDATTPNIVGKVHE